MNNLENSILFLCINLENAQHKRNQITKDWSSISVRFINAVDGKQLTSENAKIAGYNSTKRRYLYPDLFPNEIACTLSHKKCLEYFIQSEHMHAIILEDDAAPSNTFFDVLDEIITTTKNWDAIKLESRKHNKDDVFIHQLSSGNNLIVSMATSLGATGILYSRQGAKKILESLSDFYYPFDTHLGFFWKFKLTILTVTPSIIEENKVFESSIGDREPPIKEKSYLTIIRKRLTRIIHSYKKRRYAKWIASDVDFLSSNSRKISS